MLTSLFSRLTLYIKERALPVCKSRLCPLNNHFELSVYIYNVCVNTCSEPFYGTIEQFPKISLCVARRLVNLYHFSG
jgi:hypothetical protein